MIWLSSDLRFNWFWLSIDLRFNWFGCQLIEIQMTWLSIDVCFKWFWLSVDLNFKWFGCQMIFEVQVIWLSTDVWFKWFCQTKLFCETSFKNEALKLKNEAFVRDFLQKWSFEAQKRKFCARLPSKMTLWRLKTKLLCETSFKNDALKIKNEAFVRDFLQKWSFEGQNRNIFARLPSKMTSWPDTWPQNSNTF